jgi:RNA polymerase primary sigma factor
MNTYVNDFTTTVKKYHKGLTKYKPLSRVRESELLKKAQKNDMFARQEILESNLRFVFNVANKYKGKGVPMEDLISEGNVGLVTAIDRFDEKKDVKFISYAVWWIKQSIQDCIKKNSYKNEFEEYADDSLSSNDKIKSSDEELSKDITNLSFVVEEEISSKKELDTNQKYIISKLLKKLDDKGQYVMKAYYGIDQNPMTLEDIGDELGLSKERIRQIREKSLKFLRTEIMLMDDVNNLFS